MVTVVTVFLGAGYDAKDRHAAVEGERDGLWHDDSAPKIIVTIVTTVTPDETDSIFGENRCHPTAEQPQSDGSPRGKEVKRKNGQQFTPISLSPDSKKPEIRQQRRKCAGKGENPVRQRAWKRCRRLA